MAVVPTARSDKSIPSRVMLVARRSERSTGPFTSTTKPWAFVRIAKYRVRAMACANCPSTGRAAFTSGRLESTARSIASRLTASKVTASPGRWPWFRQRSQERSIQSSTPLCRVVSSRRSTNTVWRATAMRCKRRAGSEVGEAGMVCIRVYSDA